MFQTPRGNCRAVLQRLEHPQSFTFLGGSKRAEAWRIHMPPV